MLLPSLTRVFAWDFLKHAEISASSSEIDRKFWIRHPNSSPPPHYSIDTYCGFVPLPNGVLPPCALSITCFPSTTFPVANLHIKKSTLSEKGDQECPGHDFLMSRSAVHYVSSKSKA